MPELDGVSLFSLASFAVLVVAWLVAPNETDVKVVASHKMTSTEAVAA